MLVYIFVFHVWIRTECLHCLDWRVVSNSCLLTFLFFALYFAARCIFHCAVCAWPNWPLGILQCVSAFYWTLRRKSCWSHTSVRWKRRECILLWSFTTIFTRLRHGLGQAIVLKNYWKMWVLVLDRIILTLILRSFYYRHGLHMEGSLVRTLFRFMQHRYKDLWYRLLAWLRLFFIHSCYRVYRHLNSSWRLKFAWRFVFFWLCQWVEGSFLGFVCKLFVTFYNLANLLFIF